MSIHAASAGQQHDQRTGVARRRGLSTVATGLALTAVLIAAAGGAGGRGKADVDSAVLVLDRVNGESVGDAYLKLGDLTGESSSVNATASRDVVIKGQKILQN